MRLKTYVYAVWWIMNINGAIRDLKKPTTADILTALQSRLRKRKLPKHILHQIKQQILEVK